MTGSRKDIRRFAGAGLAAAAVVAPERRLGPRVPPERDPDREHRGVRLRRPASQILKVRRRPSLADGWRTS